MKSGNSFQNWCAADSVQFHQHFTSSIFCTQFGSFSVPKILTVCVNKLILKGNWQKNRKLPNLTNNFYVNNNLAFNNKKILIIRFTQASLKRFLRWEVSNFVACVRCTQVIDSKCWFLLLFGIFFYSVFIIAKPFLLLSWNRISIDFNAYKHTHTLTHTH